MILRSLKAQARLQRKAGEIYGVIVTQARHPDFYAKLGIADTPAGRYEAVVIHLFLVLERLATEGGAETLARGLIEAFVADMDDSLRELGTGDVAVGKKVRRAAAGLYERSADYRQAIAGGDLKGLERALAAHLHGGGDNAARADALARYVRGAAALLDGQGSEHVLAGQIAFPHPGAGAEGQR